MMRLKAKGLMSPLIQGGVAAILLLASVFPFQGVILAQEGYVGAQTCGNCHAEQCASQSHSNHAKALHRPSNFKLLDQLPTGLAVESADPKAARFDFRKRDSEYGVVMTVGVDQLAIPIQWIFGALDQGLTFFSRLSDGRFLEHRLSYYKRKDGFDITPGHHPRLSRTLEQAMGSLLSPEDAFRCLHCHSTYVRQTPAGPDFASVIPGVMCEGCHGPGAAHVAAMKGGGNEPSIFNPGKLSGKKQVQMCGECHRNEPEPLGTRLDDRIVVRFQPVGLQQSSCFRKSGGAITCMTCHNPHQDARRADDAFYEARCLRCHSGPPTTRCSVSPSAGCVPCHMPKTTPLPYLTFSDHWIRVHKKPGAEMK